MINEWDIWAVVSAYIPFGHPWRGATFLVSSNPLFKGLPPLCLFLGLWFSKSATAVLRDKILASAIVGIVAIALGRALALMLPFRERPIADPMLFLEPNPIRSGLQDWSSFPSDHAVFFFAMAVCLLQINRRLGIIAVLHAALIVCLPRVLLGFHYPTDLIAGAIIGGCIAGLLLTPVAQKLPYSPIATFAQTMPQLFYPLLFVLAFQLATMFDSLRNVLNFVANLLGLV